MTKIRSSSRLNTSSNPSSRGGRILLVLAVSRSDDDAAVADVVPSAAEDASTRRGNGSEWLSLLRVAESNDLNDGQLKRTNLQRLGNTHLQ